MLPTLTLFLSVLFENPGREAVNEHQKLKTRFRLFGDELLKNFIINLFQKQKACCCSEEWGNPVSVFIDQLNSTFDFF